MKNKPRLYFAHPMSEYRTPLERKALAAIRKRFPKHEVVNPSDPIFCAAVDTLYPLTGFDLFDAVARYSNVVVAMPFSDYVHGAGVFSEIASAQRGGAKLFEIDPSTLRIKTLEFKKVRSLSVEQTKKRIKAAKES